MILNFWVKAAKIAITLGSIKNGILNNKKMFVFLRESPKLILTKNLIIIGDPSKEQRKGLVRMTKNFYYEKQNGEDL